MVRVKLLRRFIYIVGERLETVVFAREGCGFTFTKGECGPMNEPMRGPMRGTTEPKTGECGRLCASAAVATGAAEEAADVRQPTAGGVPVHLARPPRARFVCCSLVSFRFALSPHSRSLASSVQFALDSRERRRFDRGHYWTRWF